MKYGYFWDKKAKKFLAPSLDKFKILPRKNLDGEVRDKIRKWFAQNHSYPKIVELLADRNVKVSTMGICRIVREVNTTKKGKGTNHTKENRF